MSAYSKNSQLPITTTIETSKYDFTKAYRVNSISNTRISYEFKTFPQFKILVTKKSCRRKITTSLRI